MSTSSSLAKIALMLGSFAAVSVPLGRDDTVYEVDPFHTPFDVTKPVNGYFINNNRVGDNGLHQIEYYHLGANGKPDMTTATLQLEPKAHGPLTIFDAVSGMLVENIGDTLSREWTFYNVGDLSGSSSRVIDNYTYYSDTLVCGTRKSRGTAAAHIVKKLFVRTPD